LSAKGKLPSIKLWQCIPPQSHYTLLNTVILCDGLWTNFGERENLITTQHNTIHRQAKVRFQVHR
jgi:hypothetical protein